MDSPNNDPVSTPRQITTCEQTLNDALGTGRAGGLCKRRNLEWRKSLSNKAYFGVWPNFGHNIWPIQVGPVSGRNALELLALRRAES